MDWSRLQRVARGADLFSLVEARDWLRVDVADDDRQILTAIHAATDFVEGPDGAGLAIVPGTQWTYLLDAFPIEICIPFGPITAIDSVQYVDTDGNPQTFASASYETDLDRGLIRPVQTASWPSTDTVYGAVTVTMTAGHTAATLPGDLKVAVLMLTAHYFENREPVGPAALEIPLGAQTIIEKYRRGRFG